MEVSRQGESNPEMPFILDRRAERQGNRITTFVSFSHNLDIPGKQLQWKNLLLGTVYDEIQQEWLSSHCLYTHTHRHRAYYLWSFYIVDVNARPASSEASWAWSSRWVLHRLCFPQQPSCLLMALSQQRLHRLTHQHKPLALAVSKAGVTPYQRPSHDTSLLASRVGGELSSSHLPETGISKSQDRV